MYSPEERSFAAKQYMSDMNEEEMSVIMDALRRRNIVPTKDAMCHYILDEILDDENIGMFVQGYKQSQRLKSSSKSKPKSKAKAEPTRAEELAYFKAKAYKSEFSSSLYYAAITPTAREKLGRLRSAKAINLYMVLSFNVDTNTGLTHSFTRKEVASQMGITDASNYNVYEKILHDAGLIQFHDDSRGWTASTKYLLVDIRDWASETVKVIKDYERKFGKPRS